MHRITWLQRRADFSIHYLRPVWLIRWEGMYSHEARECETIDAALDHAVACVLLMDAEEALEDIDAGTVKDMIRHGWSLAIATSRVLIEQECYGDRYIEMEELEELLAVGITFVRAEVKS